MKKTIYLWILIIITISLIGCQGNRHVGEVKIPLDSSVIKGKNFSEIVSEFESNGFENIKVEILDDLILGWITKDGEVESVTVDGNSDFASGSWYPKDVVVEITYHTFPIDNNSDDEKINSRNERFEEEKKIEETEIEDPKKVVFVSEINEFIKQIGPIEQIELSDLEEISRHYFGYESLSDREKLKVSDFNILNSAFLRVSYLKKQDNIQKIADNEKAKTELEKSRLENQIELESLLSEYTEEEYKALCIDYPYAEVTQDEKTYLSAYLKKDLMVRQIVLVESGETVYLCGENKGDNNYAGGLFYLFDRRSDKSTKIELYDKLYVYGEINSLRKIVTWSESRIDPYLYARFIELKGKFGE